VKFFVDALSTTPGKAVIGTVEGISKLRYITGGVDKAVQALPDSPVAAVVIGIISGCGGTLLYDFEKLARGEATNFTKPSWVFKITFWTALVYYLVAHYAKVLAPRRVKLLLGIFLVGNYLFRAIVNPDFNIFKAVGLEDILYRIARIAPSKRV